MYCSILTNSKRHDKTGSDQHTSPGEGDRLKSAGAHLLNNKGGSPDNRCTEQQGIGLKSVHINPDSCLFSVEVRSHNTVIPPDSPPHGVSQLSVSLFETGWSIQILPVFAIFAG